jgi:oxygen-dependent protoporphyrinogen oxidase
MAGRAGRVVVVGGGITGLAAAWELCRPDAADRPEVVVLEAAPRFGGIVQTSPFAGRPLDEAADSLLARVPWGVQLCEELGLGPELVAPAARTAYVWHQGALRPLPEGHVLGVPTDLDAAEASGLLTPDERAEAAHDLDATAPLLGDDRTIGSVIRERLGDAVADRLVDPLVGGINAGGIDHLSIDAVTPQLAAPARADRSLIHGLQAVRQATPPDPAAPVFRSHPKGLGHVVEVLVASLTSAGCDLRPSTAVEAIEPQGTRWQVHTGGGVIEADQVVIALPAPAASALLAPLSPGAAVLLGAVEHASVALIAVALPEAAVGRALDASGYLIPRTEHTTVTAVSWSSAKWAHLGGDGTAVLRASVGRFGDASALDMDDDDMVQRVLADLHTTMALDGDPTEVRVNRWPASLPQYTPGHLQRVEQIEAAVRADAPGLHLAGAAYRGLGVPACIRQGREAAAQTRAAAADRM